MTVKRKAKPWVRRWMVAVAAWVLVFPKEFAEGIVDAFKWAVSATREEIDSIVFEEDSHE